MVDCLVGLAQICPATVWYHIYRALPATDPSHFQQSLVYQLGSTKHHRFLPRCFIHFTPRILTISTSHRKIPPCILNFILCHQHLKFSHCVGLCLALFLFAHLPSWFLGTSQRAEFTSWNFKNPPAISKVVSPRAQQFQQPQGLTTSLQAAPVQRPTGERERAGGRWCCAT